MIAESTIGTLSVLNVGEGDLKLGVPADTIDRLSGANDFKDAPSWKIRSHYRRRADRTFMQDVPEPAKPSGDIGLLTVVRWLGRCVETRKHFWLVRCECGQEFHVAAPNLQNKKAHHTKSCGCLAIRLARDSRWKGCGDVGLSCFNHFRNGAIARGLEFSITIEYMWSLFVDQRRRCALSGLPLFIGFRSGKGRNPAGNTASLDRIDSKLGYVPGNVQWVHKTINMMKQSLSDEDFVRFCVAVSKHSGGILAWKQFLDYQDKRRLA